MPAGWLIGAHAGLGAMEEAIRKAEVLIEALPYIQRFSGRLVVIKFGGSAMASERVLDGVLQDVVFLATVGIRPLLVHGGGPQISRAMQQEGLQPRFVAGHRVTDAPTLKVVVRVLCDEVNAGLVRRIAALGGRACGAFQERTSALRARRKELRAPGSDGAGQALDLGFVGEVERVDVARLMSLAAPGNVVVIPPIGQDESGQLYNVNADTAAAAVAGAVGAEKVVFLCDVHGIMARPGEPDSLLSSLSEARALELIRAGVISGGMLPKVRACLSALEGGVRKAHIIDGRVPHSLLLEIFTDRGIGTEIVRGPAPVQR